MPESFHCWRSRISKPTSSLDGASSRRSMGSASRSMPARHWRWWGVGVGEVGDLFVPGATGTRAGGAHRRGARRVRGRGPHGQEPRGDAAGAGQADRRCCRTR